MENIKYVDFVKDYKDGNTLDDILIDDISINKEMSVLVQILESLDAVEGLLLSLDVVAKTYMRKSIIFFHIIKEYTILTIEENEDTIDNYNIILEENLKLNKFVKRIYDIIDTIESSQKEQVLKDLTESLNSIPSVEESKEIANSFNEIFSDKNKDNINFLKEITEFNDPSMKMIKDTIFDINSNIIEDDINMDKNEGV